MHGHESQRLSFGSLCCGDLPPSWPYVQQTTSKLRVYDSVTQGTLTKVHAARGCPFLLEVFPKGWKLTNVFAVEKCLLPPAGSCGNGDIVLMERLALSLWAPLDQFSLDKVNGRSLHQVDIVHSCGLLPKAIP